VALFINCVFSFVDLYIFFCIDNLLMELFFFPAACFVIFFLNQQ
jgi:hypothetical protein